MIKELRRSFHEQNSALGKIALGIGYIAFFSTCIFMLLFSTSKLHFLYIGTFLLFLACVVTLEITGKSFKLTPFDLLSIAFLVCVAISKILNPTSTFSTTPISSMLLFAAVFHFSRRCNKNIVLFLVQLSLTIFLACFYINYFNELIHLNLDIRLGSVFENENTVGYWMLFHLVLSYLFAFEKGWKSCWWLLLAPFILLGIVSTGSRSALLISGITSLCFLYLKLGIKHWKISLIGTAVLLLVAFLVLSLPQFASLRERFIKILQGTDTSSIERSQVLFEGFLAFLENPLIGWGYNGIIDYSTNHVFSHNNFVGLLSDFGLLGFLSWEALLVMPLIYFASKKQKTNKENSYIAFLLACFLIQLFFCNYQSKFMYLILGAICRETPLLWDGNFAKEDYFQLTVR